VSGWLLHQLPPVLAQDRVLGGLVLALEQIADSVRERIDGVEHQLDVDLASPEMLAYVAAWLGVTLEPSETGERQRAIVRAAGETVRWRGTRYGVERMLEAATGSRVVVRDGGGVHRAAERLGPADPVVVVQLDSTGGLTEQQVRTLLESELPVGALLELEVRYPSDGRGAGAP
jgi:phage tail-like protein